MKDDIDYGDKINYFKEVTSSNDDEKALKYLLKNKWDLEKATKNYFDDITAEEQQNRTNVNYTNLSEEIPNENRVNFSNPLIDRFFSNEERPTTSNFCQQTEHVPPRIATKSTSKNELLKFLPFHANSLSEFNQTIKQKIGIMFIYKNNDLETLNHLIDCLFRDSDMLHILESQFITYSAVDESQEAQTILKHNKLKTPCCLFMYNPRNLRENNSDIIFNILEEHFHEDILITSIYNSLANKENIEKGSYKRNIQTNLSNFQYDYEEEDDNHSGIISKQNEEMRRLEKEEEDKRRRIKFEEDLRKHKEKEEKDLMIKKQQEKERTKSVKLFKLMQLPVEPPADDKNSSHILFRHPDGIHRVERRFQNKDTIRDMYNYIESLEDVNFNNHEGKFELVQTFPYVLFNDKDKTLQEEKLFPNAVIQIREKEEIH